VPLCQTRRYFYNIARDLLYKKTSGNFDSVRNLSITHIKSMSKETAALVTTLALPYHLGVEDAKEMLQKCENLEHLDIGEFLKRHEIVREGSSGEFCDRLLYLGNMLSDPW
jgi:hypothetical protein